MANFETELLLSLSELEFDTTEELTVEAIKERKRKLSRMYHPDVNKEEIFQQKQMKINNASDFLLRYLDEVNRYIRRVNFRETEEDKRERERREEETKRRREEANRTAQEEANARAKAEQEKAQRAREEAARKFAEEMMRQAAAEAAKKAAEQAARKEAEERARRAREAEEKRRAEEAAREAARRAAEEAARRKKQKILRIILISVAALLGVALLIGMVNAFVNGVKEGNKEDKIRSIVETNLPERFVLNQNVDWSQYYVVFKDADGIEKKVFLTADMVAIDLSSKGEFQMEIKLDGGASYVYHTVHVLDCVVISSVENLKAIADDPTGTYMLGADLDLGGAEWTPIEGFNGILMGDGHTIQNLKITKFTTKNIGLFATLGKNGSISDLKLENAEILCNGSADTVGTLVGVCAGAVENCAVTAKVQTPGVSAVGGIVGMFDGNQIAIRDCSFDGSVEGNEGVGGILGGKFDSGHATLERCTVKGTVSGGAKVGGVVGQMASHSAKNYTVTDCSNAATVSARLDYCGGVVGYVSNPSSWGTPYVTITGCTNEGTVSGGSFVGGIVGSLEAKDAPMGNTGFNGHTNKADITGKNYTAGILGYTSCTLTMDRVSHTGKVKGEEYVGGILGEGGKVEIVGATNTTAVEGICMVGGIAGVASACNDCHNTADIAANGTNKDGRTALGGIAGLLDRASDCTNSGALTCVTGYAVGGIAGGNSSQYHDGEYSSCKNTGAITVSGTGQDVGGILGGYWQGTREASLSVTDCENGGRISVSGGSYVGGLVGRFDGSGWTFNSRRFTVMNCRSLAEIGAGNCTYVGGIVGYSNRASGEIRSVTVIQNVTVQGTISGSNYVGSVAGYSNSFDKIEDYESTFTIPDRELPYIGTDLSAS